MSANLKDTRPRSLRGKTLAVGLLGLILIATLLGYVRVTAVGVCSECAVHKFRTMHVLRLPFGGPEVVRYNGGSVMRLDPLTDYLGPEGDCAHKWIGLGSNGAGLTDGWQGIALDPAGNTAASEPGFGRFVADQPEVLERIRDSIRRRTSIMAWLSEEYDTWKLAQATPENR